MKYLSKYFELNYLLGHWSIDNSGVGPAVGPVANPRGGGITCGTVGFTLPT